MRAAAEAKFGELPQRLGPPTVQLDGPMNSLEVDAFMPNVEEFYAREFLVPRIADRYGFQFGMVQVTRDGHPDESPGIVAVNPERAFARMGVEKRAIGA